MRDRKDMQDNYQNLTQRLEEINKFSMMQELNIKGFNNLSQWLEESNVEKQEKIMNKCQLFIADALDQQDKINNQKLEQFFRDQVMLKSQVEGVKELRSQISSLLQKIDEKASYQNLRNLEY